MPKVKVRLEDGETLLDRLIGDRVDIAHECEGALACGSCRVVIREGLEGLPAASEDELDVLDRAGGLAPGARLACQVKGLASELVVEIPGRDARPLAGAVQPLRLSAEAVRHFRAQLAKHPGAVAVRVSVVRTGCSGFGYRVDPAQGVCEGDTQFESGGVRLVVDRASLPYVHGTTIELARAGLTRRLRFDNPNERRSCGCGESFGV